MSRLLVYIAVCAIVFYAYRAFRRQTQRLAGQMRRRQGAGRPRLDGRLVRDPRTGEYHVERD